jgi:ABC-type phosphate transport system auxiliary subunit
MVNRQTPWLWMLAATCAVTLVTLVALGVTAVIGPPLAVVLMKLIF